MTWRAICARPIARHVIYTHWDPLVLSYTASASYDAASNMWRAVAMGDMFVCRNVSAMVPPYTPDEGHHGTCAAGPCHTCHNKSTDGMLRVNTLLNGIT